MKLTAAVLVLMLLLMIFWQGLRLRRQNIGAFVRGGEYTAFALYYALFVYAVWAPAFGWPFPYVLGVSLPAGGWPDLNGEPVLSRLTDSRGWLTLHQWLAPAGVILCGIGVAGYGLCLKALGASFRVGIDEKTPGALVTDGLLSLSRNPLYISLLTLYFGLLCVFVNLAMLLNFVLSLALIYRQILREEAFMKVYYGAAYADYCKRVRRFF